MAGALIVVIGVALFPNAIAQVIAPCEASRPYIDALSDHALTQAIFATYRPDPDLPSLIDALQTRSASNPDLIGSVTGAHLCLISDRIRALRLDSDAAQALFDRCATLWPSQEALLDGLRRWTPTLRHDLRQPADHYWRKHDDRLLSTLAALQLPIDGLVCQRSISERHLIELFKAAGQAHRLTDAPTLRTLAVLGYRFHLVNILYAVDVDPTVLGALFPWYASYWARNQALDWDFLFDLQLLDTNDSRTPLAAFWALPEVRQHYDDRSADLIAGLDVRHRYDLLERVEFPGLDALVADPGRCQALLEAAFRRQDADLLQFLLVRTASDTIYARYRRVAFDVGDVMRDRRHPHRLRWVQVRQGRASYPDLMRLLVEAAPVSLWRHVADRILSDDDDISIVDIVQSRIPTWRPINAHQLPPKTAAVDVADILRRRLSDLGRIEASYCGVDRLVVLSAQYDPTLLSSIVAIANHADGDTFLHYAVQHRHDRMLAALLTLPEVDVTAENNAGCTPLDYIVTWPSCRDRRSLACAEVLVEHLDTIAERYRVRSTESPDAAPTSWYQCCLLSNWK